MTYYVVRANTYWYKFDNEEEARKQYEYIYTRRHNKYSNIDKIYLAKYENGKEPPKILEIWYRRKEKIYE